MTKKKKLKTCENFNIIDLALPNIDFKCLSKYDILGHIYHSKVENTEKYQSSTKYVICDSLETCFFCSGEHAHNKCPNVICKKCGKKGHYFKICTEKNNLKKTILCKKCSYGSHSEFDCPSIFRKYKITKINEIIKTCGRCAGSHFSDDCDQSLEVNRFSIFSEKFIKYIKSKIFKK